MSLTQERPSRQAKSPKPQWKRWRDGELTQRCGAHGCYCLFTIRDLRYGAGKHFGEHPEHQYAPCGHSYTFYTATPVEPATGNPALFEIRLPWGEMVFLFADSAGRPWICRDDEFRTLAGWERDFAPQLRARMVEAVSAWLVSDKAFEMWANSDPRFVAAEAAVTRWRTDLEPETAAKEWGEALTEWEGIVNATDAALAKANGGQA